MNSLDLVGSPDAAPRPAGGMRLPFPLSFRVQMTAALASLAVVLAVALSSVFGSMLADRSERDEGIALHTVASNAATVFADGLQARSREVEFIAASPMLWSEGLASPRVKRSLYRSQSVNTHSPWIGVADADGIVRIATGDLLVGASVKEQSWFREGSKAVHVGDVHPATQLAGLLPAASDGQPQRLVDFSAPILIEGRLAGVLALHGSWDWTREVTESLLPADAAERGIEVFIFDRAGSLISAPGRTLEAHRQAGQKLPVLPPTARQASLEPWADGAEYLTSLASVPARSQASDLGWTIVVREPARQALAAARDGARRALLLGLLAAGLTSLLGWFVADRLTRPLRRMAIAARSVEAGAANAEVALPPFAGSAEVLQLSQALAGMTNRLVTANRELEQRVQERTAALEAANAELDRQARHDLLTGLLNRRGFDDRLRQTLGLAQRHKSPISLLVFDVDHFKRVNDNHGHEVGDRVLAAIARLLMVRLRETDVLARFGGEEFVALLPDADARQARRVADEVVELIAGTPIDDVGQVTISCGVAQIREESEGLRGAMRCADDALYRAKNDGRNRAKFADTGIELSHLH